MQKPTHPILLFALAAFLLTGCMGAREIKQGSIYPSSQTLKRGTTLDIQVFRRDTKIELTNTTAQSFGKCKMWLNGRFSRDIDSLAVGQTLVLPLNGFKDEFGYSFRGGGFFASEKPDRLVLAEIQPENANQPEMLALVVIGDGTE